MTGIFVRINATNRELTTLTDEELEKWAAEMSESHQDGWSWVVSLTKWIRDHVHPGVTKTTHDTGPDFKDGDDMN